MYIEENSPQSYHSSHLLDNMGESMAKDYEQLHVYSRGEDSGKREKDEVNVDTEDFLNPYRDDFSSENNIYSNSNLIV